MTQDTQMVEVVAERLANDEAARAIAGKSDTVLFADMEAETQEFWRCLARVAISQQSVPGWQPIENKLLERRLGALMRLKSDIPQYMGEAPKAQHYQALHDELDASIALMRQQPIANRETSNPLPTGQETE